MPIEDLLARCVAQWTAEGIAPGPPVPGDEVRRVWGLLGKPLSRDVLRLYETIGGFADYVSDEEFFWCLWPWGDLVRENTRDPGPGVRFCDHSIRVVTWEFRFEDDERSAVWGRGPGGDGSVYQAAPDLESFLRTYLDDPWCLL